MHRTNGAISAPASLRSDKLLWKVREAPDGQGGMKSNRDSRTPKVDP
jgi:hypothetical protein